MLGELAILEGENFDHLDIEFVPSRRDPHELRFLSSGEADPSSHLVFLCEDVLDMDIEVRERLSGFRHEVADGFSTWGRSS